MADQSAEIKQIIQQFKDKNPRSIYLLHGEEPYYIDQIVEAATQYILEEHERDFNQTIVYGKDVNIDQLQEQAMQFPMMAQKQLIIIKEAQEIKSWGIMESYFEKPIDSTILIIAHKHKKADSRKKYVKDIKAKGVVFESKKLYENQVDGWIIQHLKEKNFTIEPKACMLMVEFLGTDISKIAKEIEKLAIILPKGHKITALDIEKNIGISKDYNVFELTNAFASRDILKANKIIHYFEMNPKAAHITAIVSLLYNFHERLLKAHFMQSADLNDLMRQLKISFPAAKDIVKAKQIYSAKKTAKNIAILQKYDLKSKGINAGSASSSDLLTELMYLLMH